ncbi:MAG: molecular chaperone TorD family protein [Thermoanaerobaculia bacterium]
MSTGQLSIPAIEARAAFASLAPLYRYPGRDVIDLAGRAWTAVRVADAAAADVLERFVMNTAATPIGELQATYTSTFDLAPLCSPYLGDHLFESDESRRARLMLGLRASYHMHEIDEEMELPDHIAVVIRLASCCGEDEWEDLGTLVLLPALKSMESILAPTGNPYRHLVNATRRLAATAFGGGAK